MVLDLLKWLKETTFYEKKKEIIKTWTFAHKESSYKEETKSSWIFWVKEKLILWISGSKGISFSTQKIGRRMIFPEYLRKLHDAIRNEKDDLSVLKKTIRWYFL